ncbi:Cys-Gln thioester bond-forming surface protein [Streptomyces pactum]|uniref:Cys-Gln thioester bond-forming surface protein n=1 Tax=Streptomyces pactum TaxID=68249 RepID=A0ABS0NI61_9ACTN|nr:Cys-Gln thioester bond-forming surface protein [Streptomyces pactum]MBH5334890.1 Cys-Gln thioester bond-forming surface protein [Streptomyces pactum]
MISARRRGAARLAAAVLASGTASAGALATAGPAAAHEVTPNPGGASATLNGLTVSDLAVVRDNGTPQQISAGLFQMTVDNGGTLHTYCIDVHTPTLAQARYQERPWNATSLHANEDAGKIRWILQNSYPQVNDLTELAAQAGSGPLTQETAAAGTQVAIWRFSDDADVEAVDPAAEKLADYLEREAEDRKEPRASLALDRPAISGRSGERLGPITVRTDAGGVTVTASGDSATSGVRVVDGRGEEVTSATDGTQLYVDVPAGTPDGAASLTAQAVTKVPVGRAFTSDTTSQTQILAGSSDSTVSATATAVWAERGPVPALTAQENCAEGGVDVTATNKGDAPFTFELAGARHTVGAGESKTITVPVKEDQPYKLTITGPDGFEETFTGALDCETARGAQRGEGLTTQLTPASYGGTIGGGSAGGGGLAATGGGDTTPVLTGMAVVLIAVGGGAILTVRRRRTAGAG